MPHRLLAAFLCCAFLLGAAKKPAHITAKGENEEIVLTATLYVDPAEIKELVGDGLEGHYVVADVKVEPQFGKQVAIDLDDFLLRSNSNGERAHPYVASQVAGKNAMVVKKVAGGNNSVNPDPNYGGGVPVPLGMPYPYGYPGGATIGGGGGDGTSNQATVNSAKDDSETPLEKTLDQKILSQKKTDKPVSGLLYFPMEKQKMKDLELLYGDKANRITLRFK
jgi:hypothetical protein